MEPEGSLPHLQVPPTSPFPELPQSSPSPTSHLLNIHLNIILLSTPGAWVLIYGTALSHVPL